MSEPDLSHIVEQLRPLAIPISSVIPDPENARLHPERNVQTIKDSIAKKGQDQPIVVRAEDRMVSKGHGRLQAMVELGHTHIAAVVVEESRISAVERGLADNRASDQAENDPVKLADLVNFVGLHSGDVIGYTDEELAELLDASDVALEAVEAAEDIGDVERLNPRADGALGSKSLPLLKFGPWQLPMTEDEAAMFQTKLDDYKAANGTVIGFAGRIVRSV